MGRILAIDYGTKRCGVAVTDSMQLIAGPLATIETRNIQQFLKEYLNKETVDTIVVGKPMRMDGSETHATAPAEKFVTSLHSFFPAVPVVQIDERFTSAIAQRSLIEMGLRKKERQKKENIDQVSAVLILQSYLEMKNR